MTYFDKGLTDRQCNWLRGIYCFVLVLVIFNLAFTTYNVVKYIYPMKERSCLITCFYIVTFLSVFTHIFLCSFEISDPENSDPFPFDTDADSVYNFFEWLGTFTILMLSWLVTATMFQLTYSIRVIFGLTTEEKAVKNIRMFYIYTISLCLLEQIITIVVPRYVERGHT